MERIDQLWVALENQSSDRSGLFKTRYSETSKAEVYFGINIPEKHRLLILRVTLAEGRRFEFRYEFKGVKFEKIVEPENPASVLLCLTLVDFQLKDIFNTLCHDIVGYIIEETEINSILQKFKSRLLKWQNLFERYNNVGLTFEEQRGLFGELYFLREWLNRTTDYERVVNAWLGPEKELQDFQSNDWAVEVKTTYGNNHQKVHIQSERQLDSSNLNFLYLYHISLDVRNNSGETLNQIVHSIRTTLATAQSGYSLFNIKLLKTGYFDNHISLYEEKGYFIREDVFYNVVDRFPRIQENDLMNGVGDVKYSIIVSSLDTYSVTHNSIFEKLTYNE